MCELILDGLIIMKQCKNIIDNKGCIEIWQGKIPFCNFRRKEKDKAKLKISQTKGQDEDLNKVDSFIIILNIISFPNYFIVYFLKHVY